METLAVGETFLFECFRLDRRGLSQRDERGVFAPVAIGSRALDVLGVLVGADGDVVSKDQIMAAVWPGTVVEDNNLTVQIAALRRILDRGRAEASRIQTVAGRGYRFVATVTRQSADVGSNGAAVSDGGGRLSTSVSREPPVEGPGMPQGHPERRLVTVLSCCIAGFAPPAGELDPEEVLAKLAALHNVCHR